MSPQAYAADQNTLQSIPPPPPPLPSSSPLATAVASSPVVVPLQPTPSSTATAGAPSYASLAHSPLPHSAGSIPPSLIMQHQQQQQQLPYALKELHDAIAQQTEKLQYQQHLLSQQQSQLNRQRGCDFLTQLRCIQPSIDVVALHYIDTTNMPQTNGGNNPTTPASTPPTSHWCEVRLPMHTITEAFFIHGLQVTPTTVIHPDMSSAMLTQTTKPVVLSIKCVPVGGGGQGGGGQQQQQQQQTTQVDVKPLMQQHLPSPLSAVPSATTTAVSTPATSPLGPTRSLPPLAPPTPLAHSPVTTPSAAAFSNMSSVTAGSMFSPTVPTQSPSSAAASMYSALAMQQQPPQPQLSPSQLNSTFRMPALSPQPNFSLLSSPSNGGGSSVTASPFVTPPRLPLPALPPQPIMPMQSMPSLPLPLPLSHSLSMSSHASHSQATSPFTTPTMQNRFLQLPLQQQAMQQAPPTPLQLQQQQQLIQAQQQQLQQHQQLQQQQQQLLSQLGYNLNSQNNMMQQQQQQALLTPQQQAALYAQQLQLQQHQQLLQQHQQQQQPLTALTSITAPYLTNGMQQQPLPALTPLNPTWKMQASHAHSVAFMNGGDEFSDINSAAASQAKRGIGMISSHGKSCHACKNTKSIKTLAYCTNVFSKRTKPDTRRCMKKYCNSCLRKFYNENLPLNALEWICPSCQGKCVCAACVRHAQVRNAKDGLVTRMGGEGIHSSNTSVAHGGGEMDTTTSTKSSRHRLSRATSAEDDALHSDDATDGSDEEGGDGGERDEVVEQDDQQHSTPERSISVKEAAAASVMQAIKIMQAANVATATNSDTAMIDTPTPLTSGSSSSPSTTPSTTRPPLAASNPQRSRSLVTGVSATSPHSITAVSSSVAVSPIARRRHLASEAAAAALMQSSQSTTSSTSASASASAVNSPPIGSTSKDSLASPGDLSESGSFTTMSPGESPGFGFRTLSLHHNAHPQNPPSHHAVLSGPSSGASTPSASDHPITLASLSSSPASSPLISARALPLSAATGKAPSPSITRKLHSEHTHRHHPYSPLTSANSTTSSARKLGISGGEDSSTPASGDVRLPEIHQPGSKSVTLPSRRSQVNFPPSGGAGSNGSGTGTPLVVGADDSSPMHLLLGASSRQSRLVGLASVDVTLASPFALKSSAASSTSVSGTSSPSRSLTSSTALPERQVSDDSVVMITQHPITLSKLTTQVQTAPTSAQQTPLTQSPIATSSSSEEKEKMMKIDATSADATPEIPTAPTTTTVEVVPSTSDEPMSQ